MPDTGLQRSPKVQKGALVQLVETLNIPLPNIVPFQYNPEKVSRTLEPWNPMEADDTHRGLPSPTAQPFDPQEGIEMQIELDAADRLEDGDPIAEEFGVGDRIAALEKMLFPGSSPLGQLLSLAVSLTGASPPPQRPTVPVTFLVFGVGRIVPVRITRYSIEEQLFLPSLRVLQARISLSMTVLTPDVFKGVNSPTVSLAIAAYKFYRGQQDVLALINVGTSVGSLRALLPF
ncbi:MAG TPA: hypothetical protein VHO06_27330 [Polyangia bacterium]|nr:hypothetical protein [Polyangia bacterium]